MNPCPRHVAALQEEADENLETRQAVHLPSAFHPLVGSIAPCYYLRNVPPGCKLWRASILLMVTPRSLSAMLQFKRDDSNIPCVSHSILS